jgi:predicted small lipoprotein YifL
MDHQTEILGSPLRSVRRQGLGRPFSSAFKGLGVLRSALRLTGLAAALTLGACGQKGPLYLPAPAGVPAQLAAASAPLPIATPAPATTQPSR